MKIELFKTKAKNFKKGGFHTNPDISWEIVLYVAFAIVLASFVFGFFLFRQVNKDFANPPAGENPSDVHTIKKERIDKALEYFSLRQQKSEEITDSPSPIIDPSL